MTVEGTQGREKEGEGGERDSSYLHQCSNFDDCVVCGGVGTGLKGWHSGTV